SPTSPSTASMQEGDGDGGEELDLHNDAQVEAAFQKYYLRKVTAEYADDIDTLRSADDFTDASLLVLVNALQQGSSIFSLQEKRQVLAGRTGAGRGRGANHSTNKT
ncbi:MAG: hypothetical protein M1838_005783, partial [Thelocarpon superellum]